MLDLITVLVPAMLIVAMATAGIQWLAQQRLWQQPGDDATALVQPPFMLKLGLFCSTFCCFALVAMHLWPSCRSEAWVHVGFLGGALGSLYMVADYYLGRHSVDDLGVDYGSVLGQRDYFRWDDVVQVACNHEMEWYRIDLLSGATVRISARMIGMPVFARQMYEHVPDVRFKSRSRSRLGKAAKGGIRRI